MPLDYVPYNQYDLNFRTFSTHRKILFQILSWRISRFELDEPDVRPVVQRWELRCHVDDKADAVCLESGSRYYISLK